MPSTRTIAARAPAHGHSRDEQGKADEDRLDERHPHHALCDGADSRRGEAGEAGPALLAGEALEDGQASASAAFAEGHEDAGEDEGAEKGEQAAADAGDEAERRPGEFADLRLLALHKGGQIVVRLAPHGVELFADDGPARDGRGRGRDLQCVLLHGLDQGPDGVTQRTHQQGDRHDENCDPEQRQQSRGEPGPSAEKGGDAQVQGVEGHREDQGPDREREEGGQNAVAEQRQREENGGADQHIEQAAGEASFEIRVGCGERRHDGSVVLGVCQFTARPFSLPG